MGLINYTEAVDLGSFFAGLGVLLLMGTFSYIFYRLYNKMVQYVDVVINRESKYEILEEAFLDKIGTSKGIDLNKELVRRQMFQVKKKSFRRRVEEQIYEDMFGKEENKS